MKLEFVSYDGKFPNLCSGVLILRLDGAEIKFPSHTLRSGGYVSFDESWHETVACGEWWIDVWPEGFPKELEPLVLKLINENIPQGCCGGCV